MKTKITAAIVVVIALAVSLRVADSTNSPSDPGVSAELREELQQTQVQLNQLTIRITGLEQKIRALEQSNGELQQEVRRLQVPREPRWDHPKTNQSPHLTPLQFQ
jgi:TolA-binding protein